MEKEKLEIEYLKTRLEIFYKEQEKEKIEAGLLWKLAQATVRYPDFVFVKEGDSVRIIYKGSFLALRFLSIGDLVINDDLIEDLRVVGEKERKHIRYKIVEETP